MQWLNEPNQWSQTDNTIIVKTSPKTDFWRLTHYGFIRDNGHFYFDEITQDFIVTVNIKGNYQELYDQAGIMIRANEKHWIKTGIEYVDGVQNLSAVVTHNYSDWSVIPWIKPDECLKLQVRRCRETIEISYFNQEAYQMFRTTYLPNTSPLKVGIMCASPEGKGYEVTFENYQITLILDAINY